MESAARGALAMLLADRPLPPELETPLPPLILDTPKIL